MSFSATDMQSNQLPGFGNFSRQKLAISDVHASKVKKLFAESVEVTLALCHQYLGIIGQVKLTDVIKQIIPTGWILSTGYWPYFSNQQGHCLCVCCRFAIPCRHVRNYDHWLDLSSSTDFLLDPTAISLPTNASISVTNFECNVTQLGGELYNINAKFQILVGEGGKLIGRKEMWLDNNYKLGIERYPSIEVYIMFHPSPQSMPGYGKILNEVLVNNGMQDTFVTSNSSKHTFISFPCNDNITYTTIAFPMFQNKTPIRNQMSDVCTQTEGSGEIASFQQHQQFAHSSLAVPELTFQAPSASTTSYNQVPPPYSFPQPTINEGMQYRERLDRRGRQGPRGAGSSGEGFGGFGNVPLSMFLAGDVSQPPQASRGRKQRKAGRRPKAETRVETVTRETVTRETAPEDLANQMDAELNLIDELFK